jgi:pilus assembly protein CpaC
VGNAIALVPVDNGPPRRPAAAAASAAAVPAASAATSAAAATNAESSAKAPVAPEAQAKAGALIAELIGTELELQLEPHKSKLLRTRVPVSKVSITDPDLLEIVQFGPTEFELIPRTTGETTMTFWFGDQILRYLVRIGRDLLPEERAATEYGDLQKKINEMFPNSMIQLIPLADKLLVRGQARDSAEAAQILAVLGGQGVDQAGKQLGPTSIINVGTAPKLPGTGANLPAHNIISLLDVPGEQQVMLKVRVAELNRSAMRNVGWNVGATGGDFSWASLYGITSPFSAILSTADLTLTLQALSTNSYSKVLAEPNLVTMNGQPASFISGGEFAVPTVVGVQGVSAVSTGFRGFGTQLTFTPTIIDKDRFRLTVAPSFSTIDQSIAVAGIPGLNTRAVQTVVELREGQWLAIGGLVQDQQSGSKSRVPFLGDIPIIGSLFSQAENTRDETELIVLVSPELVHPLEAQEVPLVLPGMDVTEPTDCEFFVGGRYVGNPCRDYRSTTWPEYQNRVVDAQLQARHAAREQSNCQRSENYYLYGTHGFSR